MKPKIGHLIHIFIWVFMLPAFAQKQNNFWYFGNQAALDFNSGNPVSITSSAMLSLEGCASVCDSKTGALLFYTNGLQIWDSKNKVMPNGDGILGGPTTSSTQGVLIAEYPDNPKKYFVFTVDETINNAANGFRYSVVDMALNNGMGDIVNGQKNILIQNNTTERLTLTKKADESGFWLLIHERNNNRFKAYEITQTGLNTQAVISNTGSNHTASTQANGDATMGCMRFNNAGNKLAVALYAANTIEVFDFDKCTGIVSNPTSISTLDNPYGLEFSPDDTKLYYSLYYNAGFNGAIYQLDMQSANIAASSVLVGISSSDNNQSVGALQLAPDSKIYICINNKPWLSAITQPNNLGASCGFVDTAIVLKQAGLSPSPGIFGLPQKVLVLDSASLRKRAIRALNLCENENAFFSISGNPFFTSISWDFGDTFSLQNTDTARNTTHTYSKAGAYIVKAIITNKCGGVDTLIKSINVILCNNNNPICELLIPNAFSPNGDGVNDVFTPITMCSFSHYECLIFNRWGELVFKTNKPGIYWDGNYLNAKCPRGVYAYLITYKFTSQEQKKSKGTITLTREK